MSLDTALIWILSLINLGIISMIGLFTYESIREQESRAPKIGAAAISFHLLLGVLILVWPDVRIPLAWVFGFLLAAHAIFLIPHKGKTRSLKGAAGYLASDGSGFHQMDERDTMFARNRTIKPGTEQYDRYYAMHPEHKEYDDRRRARGGPLGKPGSIDGSYRPNVSMLVSSFELPNMLGLKTHVIPGSAASQSTYADKDSMPPPADLDPVSEFDFFLAGEKRRLADLPKVNLDAAI